MSKLAIYFIDLCQPDYFGGTPEPHLSVPVTWRTTADDLREALHAEISMGAVARLPDPEPAGWYEAAHAAVDALDILSDWPFASSIEPVHCDDCHGTGREHGDEDNDDDCPTCDGTGEDPEACVYAYFEITT